MHAYAGRGGGRRKYIVPPLTHLGQKSASKMAMASPDVIPNALRKLPAFLSSGAFARRTSDARREDREIISDNKAYRIRKTRHFHTYEVAQKVKRLRKPQKELLCFLSIRRACVSEDKTTPEHVNFLHRLFLWSSRSITRAEHVYQHDLQKRSVQTTSQDFFHERAEAFSHWNPKEAARARTSSLFPSSSTNTFTSG